MIPSRLVAQLPSWHIHITSHVLATQDLALGDKNSAAQPESANSDAAPKFAHFARPPDSATPNVLEFAEIT